MKYGSFASLDELRKAVLMGLDIEFYLNERRYNISTGSNGPFLCLCPSGWCVDFKTSDELLDCIVDGFPLRDQWAKIKIIGM